MDFAKLYMTDVKKHITKKGRFSYLSWPFAVAEFRKACPNGTWKSQTFGENDQPYCVTDSGPFVVVHVWPDVDKTELYFTQTHPVLDHKNKTIDLPDSFQINTSIQRCLVKAIALATGIGLHIYAGEDLPEEPKKDNGPPARSPLDKLKDEVDMLGSLDEFNDWHSKHSKRVNGTLSGEPLAGFRRYFNNAKSAWEPK